MNCQYALVLLWNLAFRGTLLHMGSFHIVCLSPTLTEVFRHLLSSCPKACLKDVERWKWLREVGWRGGVFAAMFKAEAKEFPPFLQSGLNFLKTSRCFHLIMPFWRFAFCFVEAGRLSWALSVSRSVGRTALKNTSEGRLSGYIHR